MDVDEDEDEGEVSSDGRRGLKKEREDGQTARADIAGRGGAGNGEGTTDRGSTPIHHGGLARIGSCSTPLLLFSPETSRLRLRSSAFGMQTHL